MKKHATTSPAESSKRAEKAGLTPDEFDALYWANRAAPDQPSAEVAYWRTEAAVFMQYGCRMYSNYNSFKVNLSKRTDRRRKQTGQHTAPDPRQILSATITVVNAYLCSLDLTFLQKYHAEIAQRAAQMEAFGPLNGTYHPDDLRHLKATASQLAALIQYIQNLPK